MLTIAQHVNERSGLAKVGDERLASLSRLNRKTVRREIKALQELGELLVIERGSSRSGERRVPTTYQLVLVEAEPPLFELEDRGSVTPGSYPQPGALSPSTGCPESLDRGSEAPLTLLYSIYARARDLVEIKPDETARLVDRLRRNTPDNDLAAALDELAVQQASFRWTSELDLALGARLSGATKERVLGCERPGCEDGWITHANGVDGCPTCRPSLHARLREAAP